MISSKQFHSSVVDGTLTRFLSDFIIATEQHVRVYNFICDPINGSDITDILDPNGSGLYLRATNNPKSTDLVSLDKWDLVTNSILFYTAPVSGSDIHLEVSTNPEDFGGTLIQPSVERAEAAADLAGASEINTAADAVQTGLDKVATNADVVITNADKVATNADVVLTGLDKVATNADVVITNADVILTASDKITTAADVVATALDKVATNADVVSTNADKVATNADVVITNADVISTAADVVSTAADVASVDPLTTVHTTGSGLDNELLTYLKTLDGVGSGLDADYIRGKEPGVLLQVVSKLITAQYVQYLSANTEKEVAASGVFTLAITPKASGSKFKIYVRHFGEMGYTYNAVYNIKRNGSKFNGPNNSTWSGISMSTVTYEHANNNNSTPDIMHVTTLDTAGSTAGVAITYKLVITSVVDSNQYTNRCYGSTGGIGYENGSSEIIIEEIGA